MVRCSGQSQLHTLSRQRLVQKRRVQPSQFENLGGRSAAKKWKTSIKVRGITGFDNKEIGQYLRDGLGVRDHSDVNQLKLFALGNADLMVSFCRLTSIGVFSRRQCRENRGQTQSRLRLQSQLLQNWQLQSSLVPMCPKLQPEHHLPQRSSHSKIDCELNSATHLCAMKFQLLPKSCSILMPPTNESI